MKFNIKNATIAASIFCLLGIADLIARIYYLGFTEGLKASVNDPGKSFFHIVILPVIVFLLMRFKVTSKDLIKKIRSKSAYISVLMLILCAATIQAVWETKNSFFIKNSSPEEFNSSTLRREYIDVRNGLTKLLQNKDLELSIAQCIAGKIDILDYAELAPGGWEKLTGDQARDIAYAKARDILGASPSVYSYFRLASLRRHISTILHLLGNLVAAWLFFAACFAEISNVKTTKRDRDLMLILISLFSLWLPLRLYSEWHLQFSPDVVEYEPILIGAIVSVFATAVVFIRSSRELFASIAPGAITLFCGAFSLFFQSEGEYFSVIADAYRNASVPFLLIIHVAFFSALVGISMHVNQLIEKSD